MPDRLATSAVPGTEAGSRGFNASDYTVWIADSDQAAAAGLAALLQRAGYRTRTFHSGEAVLEAAEAWPPRSCLIADMELPGITGLELVARLRERHVEVPVLILTRLGDVATAVRAMRERVSDYLVKPYVERDLVARLRNALVRDRAPLH
jgi:FixJ family two-component response regulator